MGGVVSKVTGTSRSLALQGQVGASWPERIIVPQSVRVGRVSWLPMSLVRVKEWHTADFDLGSSLLITPSRL